MERSDQKRDVAPILVAGDFLRARFSGLEFDFKLENVSLGDFFKLDQVMGLCTCYRGEALAIEPQGFQSPDLV